MNEHVGSICFYSDGTELRNVAGVKETPHGLEQRSAVHHFDVDGKSKAELDTFLLALGCRRVPTRVGENTARKRVDLMCRALRIRFDSGAWFSCVCLVT